MKFRLVYKGELPPTNDDNEKLEIKQKIRKKFHPQLKKFIESNKVSPGLGRKLQLFERKGFKFRPIIDKKNRCSLDILFLRSDAPGKGFAGDIDNRVKTLLDALSVPGENELLPLDSPPDKHEKPLFCLLEDDSLVTQLSVEMDHLFDLDLQNGSKNCRAVCQLIITIVLEPGLFIKGEHLYL